VCLPHKYTAVELANFVAVSCGIWENLPRKTVVPSYHSHDTRQLLGDQASSLAGLSAWEQFAYLKMDCIFSYNSRCVCLVCLPCHKICDILQLICSGYCRIPCNDSGML